MIPNDTHILIPVMCEYVIFFFYLNFYFTYIDVFYLIYVCLRMLGSLQQE